MLAVVPPVYFPPLAYAALLQEADRVVLADTFQYSRQSHQNRARLRTPPRKQGASMWITVPLQRPRHGRAIREVEIDPHEAWAGPHLRAWTHNYRTTPFFAFYEPELHALLHRPWTHLGALTCATVEQTARWLRIETPLVRASELPGAPATLAAIQTALGEPDLLAPAASAAYDRALVEGPVYELHYDAPPYRQNFDSFEPGMTALDLLFNYGPEAPAMLRRGTRVIGPASTSA